MKKKQELELRKNYFIYDCLKFLETRPILADLEKYVLKKCEKYFPRCDRFLKNSAYDFMECVNNLYYFKLFFEEFVEKYYYSNLKS